MGLEYLERYYVLIAFTAYLSGPAFAPGDAAAHVPVGEWLEGRPELHSILARLLRGNPLAALALNAPTVKGLGEPVCVFGGGGGGGCGEC